MPLYLYRGLSEDGTPVTGERVAASRQDLEIELRHEGTIVKGVRRKVSLGSLFRKKLNPKTLLVFVHEFSVMLRSGMSIQESLQLIAGEQEFPELKLAIGSVINDLNSGVEFSMACSRFPDVFDPLFIRTIKIGEQSGNVSNALVSYQRFLKRKIGLGKKISQAMTYPTFLLVAMSAIVGVLLLFVMPRFIGLYSEFEAELPFMTEILIHIVDQMYIYAPAFFVVIALLVIGFRLLVETDIGRLRIDAMKLRLPFVGKIYSHAVLAQSSRVLGALITAGTPLVEALKSTSASLTNSAVAIRFENSSILVSEGNTLAFAFQKEGVFPPIAQRMIRAGENSGSLEDMLDAVAEYYEESASEGLDRLISLVEPISILLMGGLIGSVIVIMYLPIIHMVDIIR